MSESIFTGLLDLLHDLWVFAGRECLSPPGVSESFIVCYNLDDKSPLPVLYILFLFMSFILGIESKLITFVKSFISVSLFPDDLSYPLLVLVATELIAFYEDWLREFSRISDNTFKLLFIQFSFYASDIPSTSSLVLKLSNFLFNVFTSFVVIDPLLLSSLVNSKIIIGCKWEFG